MTSCPYEFSLANLPGSPIETPLSHLTTTNNPPTDNEIGLARAIIDADKVSIDQIDKVLEDLSNLQKMIQNLRAEYTQRIDLHKQIFKPHRSLPSDVLCEIFQHVLFAKRAIFGSRNSSHKFLGQVCHRWRNILFSNPRLWTMLPEFDLNPSWTRRKAFNSMLKAALQLSRAAPLNLEIRHVEPSNFAPHPALTALLPSSDRYRRLSLSIFHQYLPQLASIRGKLGGLRSLVLHIPGDYRANFIDSISMPPLKLFDNAPNLQNLTVNAPFVQPLCEWFSVPWQQLVLFSGHWIKPIDIVTLLTHATSLEDCTFYCVLPPTALGFLANVIHHRLVKLRIYFEGGEDQEPPPLDVLNGLTLPGLVELTIKDIPLQSAILVDLVARSSCILTFVDLDTSISDDISSFLDLISDVHILCIIPTESLVRFLFQDLTQQPVFPHLRHITFYTMAGITVQALTWIPLARTVQMVDPLATFTIAKLQLRRSHYEALYDQLDGWSGLDTWETHFPVYERWKNLIESSSFGETLQDPMQQMILAQYLTEIESLGILHPRYLYESSILPSTTPLCQIRIEYDQYLLQARLSGLVARWMSLLDTYLNCFGWMHPPLTDFDRPTEIVYGKREGSLLLSASVTRLRSVFQK